MVPTKMLFTNLSDASEQVDFKTAVLTGLGRNQGLFFPDNIDPLDNIDELLALDFVDRSTRILGLLTGDSFSDDALAKLLQNAFNFPVPLVEIQPDIRALELFHGPSLAFKDFGARFLAGCFNHFAVDEKLTILTATSGDTGAAVAHAFHGLDNVRVVILYPQGRISSLQEKLFCTLGGNIHTIAVQSDFDSCQRLIKKAFDDPLVREPLRLNSANSINIARLVAQVCYYFEAIARGGDAVISVPSGNFGNVTAGLIARRMGLPIKRLIAATNANDTVPRFMETGNWEPRETVATLTNAMDVSQPNNFPRVMKLAEHHEQEFNGAIYARRISERQTEESIRSLYAQGYLADPHTALASAALMADIEPGETGTFLCTAHPAKFRETISDTLGFDVELPPELEAVKDKEVLSAVLPADYMALQKFLLNVGSE
jgi:threonine synthase